MDVFAEIGATPTLVGLGVVASLFAMIPILWGAIRRTRIFWRRYHPRKSSIYVDYVKRIELSGDRSIQSTAYFMSVVGLKFSRSIIIMIYYYILSKIYGIAFPDGVNIFGFDDRFDRIMSFVFLLYFLIIAVIVAAIFYEIRLICLHVKRHNAGGLEGD